MASPDPRVDQYIASAPPFARPILAALRAQVHDACPDVEETLKWRAPSFVYHGRILAFMAAFQRHASFGFWQHAQVMGGDAPPREGMGSIGRLATLGDLPSSARLGAWIRRAMALIDEDAPGRPRARRAPTPPQDVPVALSEALATQAAARRGFQALSPGQQRDYAQWIGEARREDTRARRLAQALEWLAQGRPRDWKYRAR